MQLGMVGLGRMGANLVRRAMAAGHECIVYDVDADAVAGLVEEGAIGANSLADVAAKLQQPRSVWIMVPAGLTDRVVTDVTDHLDEGDIVIDGGNSHYHDDIVRAARLSESGIHYVDIGTSGGVFGLERGFCLMIGGEEAIVDHLDPIFRAPCPRRRHRGAHPRTGGRTDAGRTRIPALWAGGCGTYGQDGPQRHRVRHHGRLCRGAQHLESRRYWFADPESRCRDNPFARAGPLPVRHRHR